MISVQQIWDSYASAKSEKEPVFRVELETEDERYERLRTTRERMLFQELTIPKNVAAYYEGKDGYFKKSGYRRT